MAVLPHLTDENAEARAYFRAQADRYFASPKISTDLSTAIKAYTSWGLATGQMPLEMSYLHTARQLTERRVPTSSVLLRAMPNGNGLWGAEIRYEKLCDALKEKNPPLPPVVVIGGHPRLLSSWDLHQRVVDKDTYYLGRATQQNVTDYIDHFAEAIDGADLWELVIGNGHMAAKRLEKVIKAGAMPRTVYIHDLASKPVLKEAAAELEKVGIPKDKIKYVPGLDLFSPEFSYQTIQKHTRKNSSEINPKQCVMIEGIINDLTIEERYKLHNKTKEVFPGARIVTIDDNTVHIPTLEKAYNYPEIPQWLIRSYVPSLWEVMLYEADPYAINTHMGFSPHDKGVTITPNITSSGQQLILPNRIKYRLPKIQPCHAIYKILPEESLEQLETTKMGDIASYPFRGSPEFSSEHVRVTTWMYNTPKLPG